MVKINGTDITLTRGDSLKVKVDILNADGSEYTPVEGDSVRFAMKYKYSDAAVIINKDIPLDTLVLQFDPDDTKELEMQSKFVYDIELTHANGDVDTFIKGNFYIDAEVL